jgi:hypothetical protein
VCVAGPKVENGMRNFSALPQICLSAKTLAAPLSLNSSPLPGPSLVLCTFSTLWPDQSLPTASSGS